MQSVNYYSDSSCSSPVYLEATTTSSCAAADCTATTTSSGTYYATLTCPTDGLASASDVFGDASYLLNDMYIETTCDTPYYQLAYLATGECVASGSGSAAIATIFSNGSAKLELFADSTCSTSLSSTLVSGDQVSSHTCSAGNKFYTNVGGSVISSGGSGSIVSTTSNTGSTFFDTGSSSTSDTGGTTATGSGSGSLGSSGVSVGVIAGIAVGVIILLVLIVGCCCWRRRNKNKKQQHVQVDVPSPVAFERVVTPTTQMNERPKTSTRRTTETETLSSAGGTMMSKLWDDEAIIAARIPREKVIVESLINKGGFGEVYAGTYNGRPVAIKMLLPERKKSLAQVNAFLSEVKLMTTLDHPHIVEFIGVAWDSLTDLCVVTEYMTIDLKALLSKFEEQRLPIGFDHDKVKIALHVAHALTYLHSCDPPVIHRDLKSSNILLNEVMDAKVTDFGISRERIDATMTAGVGTSLWMAPEVMMGERYDDKADMFSFGVVLSELDQHTTPYSHAKHNSVSGQRLTDPAILQMVAMGKLRVQFSGFGPSAMVELGFACVSVDPKQRPTAAEALYRLQKILANDL